MTRSEYTLYSSAMSISPLSPVIRLFCGHIQSELCRPATFVAGNLARTAKRPYVWLNRPHVATWAAVYEVVNAPLGLLHTNGAAVLRVVRFSTPSPTAMLSGELTKQDGPAA